MDRERLDHAAGGSDYFVRLTGEWPAAEEESCFYLTLQLRKRDRRLAPGQPLRLPDDPVLLECGRPLLQKLVARAMDDGYAVRVDVARALAAVEPWPRWCLSANQFASVLDTLVGKQEPRLDVYPVSIWLLPVHQAGGEDAIALFRTLPADEEMFDLVMSRGVLRLSASDAYCDIMGDRREGDRMVGWLKDSIKGLPASSVEWRVEAPEL